MEVVLHPFRNVKETYAIELHDTDGLPMGHYHTHFLHEDDATNTARQMRSATIKPKVVAVPVTGKRERDAPNGAVAEPQNKKAATEKEKETA